MIYVVARCTVFPGKAENARKAIGDLVALCKENEPGLLMYEIYFNESETELHVLEKYKDNDAMLNHLKKPEGRIDAIKKNLIDAVEFSFVGFLGAVSEEVMAAYELFNPTAYKHLDGFTR